MSKLLSLNLFQKHGWWKSVEGHYNLFFKKDEKQINKLVYCRLILAKVCHFYVIHDLGSLIEVCYRIKRRTKLLKQRKNSRPTKHKIVMFLEIWQSCAKVHEIVFEGKIKQVTPALDQFL